MRQPTPATVGDPPYMHSPRIHWSVASPDRIIHQKSPTDYARHEWAEAIWHDAVAAPGWAGPAVWLHGDLHPANVLTEDGNLCGIVDFGDLCAGDPAVDLAACWILLPDEAGIHRFQRTYQLTADAATWRRARGWAGWRAVGSLLIAEAGRRGHPGGKPTWGPPALASLRLLTASVDGA